jgi:D-glutamate N-acetyltransferase
MTKPINLRKPYLLFVGTARSPIDAKTAAGVAYWRPEHCRAQLRLDKNAVDLGFPDTNVRDAAAAGCATFVIGLAPVGAYLPDSWVSLCVEVLEAGMDIASGLHVRVGAIPAIAEAAARSGTQVFDVREPPPGLPCGTGGKRAGKRLLTVGTDCCVGKMFSALAIDAELRRRGVKSTFRATGQTGILIQGSGLAIDAVVSDFLSGSVEVLAPENHADHWDVIEGQGSLYHPAYAAVSLGLLHGAQADALVLCHELDRTAIDGDYEGYPIPDLEEVIALNLQLARRTNGNAALAGLSVNSSNLGEDEALASMAELEKALNVPVVDPVRTGVSKLVDELK